MTETATSSRAAAKKSAYWSSDCAISSMTSTYPSTKPSPIACPSPPAWAAAKPDASSIAMTYMTSSEPAITFASGASAEAAS